VAGLSVVAGSPDRATAADRSFAIGFSISSELEPAGGLKPPRRDSLTQHALPQGNIERLRRRRRGDSPAVMQRRHGGRVEPARSLPYRVMAAKRGRVEQAASSLRRADCIESQR